MLIFAFNLLIFTAILLIFKIGVDFQHFKHLQSAENAENTAYACRKVLIIDAEKHIVAYAYVKLQSPAFSEEHGGSASYPPGCTP